jgi:phage shock protein A
MKSETLRDIRTMRDIKTGLAEATSHRIKTIGSRHRLEPKLPTGQFEQVLAREKRRFASCEASIEGSQRRLLTARQKLALIINRNRALTALRHALQRERWENRAGSLTGLKTRPISCSKKLHEVELRY